MSSTASSARPNRPTAPATPTGRIGLDWYRKDPKIVFAIVDSEKAGTGPPTAPSAYVGFQGEEEDGETVKITQIFENAPSAKAGLKVDDLITALDGKPVGGYEKMLESLQGKKV